MSWTAAAARSFTGWPARAVEAAALSVTVAGAGDDPHR
jgi:hypothetical protein